MALINETDIEWSETERGETRFKRKELSNAAEGEMLGCSLYELPPESKSWPYHYHTANEEAMFVLEGRGLLRHDGKRNGLEAGDYVHFPANGSGGHRVINNSDEMLRYLVLSTMNEPDLTVYPDSEKMGVYVRSPPGGRENRPLEGYYNIDDDVDYWEGE